MTEDGRGQTVVDHVGACGCPRTPHASGETVTLHGRVPLAMGAAAMAALQGVSGTDEYVGLLAPIYLRFGIDSWTCLGDDGALPVTTANIAERFPWADGGAELVEAADALYGEEILRPLQRRIARLSPPTPTAPPTSATPSSGDAPRSPSAPSSRARSAAGEPSGAPAR